MNTKEKLAYIAGVIDSDGWFTVIRNNGTTRPNYSTNLGIAQKEEHAVLLAKELFGGLVRLQDFANYKRYSPTPMWQWVLSGEKLTQAIPKLLPYLLIKRDRALLSLELRESIERWRKFNPTPDAIYKKRESIYEKMKAINNYGSVAETKSRRIGETQLCDSPSCKDSKLAELGRNDQVLSVGIE